MYALDGAVDELRCTLQVDSVELRQIDDAKV